MDPGSAKRRQRKILLRTVAEFSKIRAGIQRDAGQIRQHSPLNAPQHLGAGAALTAAEASTSTSTTDPSTSKERQMQVETGIETFLQELHRQYRAAQGEELIAIQNLAEDVIMNALATGDLSADEVGVALMRFSVYPAVADKGSPTGIVDDTGCNLVADAGSPENKIIQHDPDFFNAFEDDFDDKDLN